MPDGGVPDGLVAAVIFDLDGVLIDSEELWDLARRRLAADAGVAWPAEATRAMQGMSTFEWSRYLVEDVGVPGSPSDVAVATIDRMADEYARTLPLLPGGGRGAAIGGALAAWFGLVVAAPIDRLGTGGRRPDGLLQSHRLNRRGGGRETVPIGVPDRRRPTWRTGRAASA